MPGDPEFILKLPPGGAAAAGHAQQQVEASFERERAGLSVPARVLPDGRDIVLLR